MAFVALAAGTPAPAGAQASASGACGVSLTPAATSVKRGGQVLLEGEACGAGATSSATGKVQVKLRQKRRWKTVARAETDTSGRFTVCARLAVSAGTKVARLRATTPGGTGTTTVRVRKGGSSGCESTEAAPEQGQYKPPPPETGNPACPLSIPNSEIGLALPESCTVVASDTAASADPSFFWDRIECESASRHQRITAGGDEHPTGLGAPQGDGAFRRMTVRDGDDFYGERCELGHNNMNAPTAFYHEGQRRVTFASIRMPASSPIGNSGWRNVLQMKQAQPYNNPNPASIFEMQVRDSRWEIGSNWSGVWSAPATQNTWTRFAFDIVYSKDPSVGSVKIYVDLNSDGDADDAGEQSPRIFKQTLQVETAPAHPDGVGAGQSIPSHLRAGIYQDPAYSCPTGCSVDIDNVQVVKA